VYRELDGGGGGGSAVQGVGQGCLGIGRGSGAAARRTGRGSGGYGEALANKAWPTREREREWLRKKLEQGRERSRGSTGSIYRGEGRRRKAGEGRENGDGHHNAIDGVALTTTVTSLKERGVGRVKRICFWRG
jgi:hypothetical protein